MIFGGLLRVPIGFTLDSLSKTMLVIVSGVVRHFSHLLPWLHGADDTGQIALISPRSRSSCFKLGIVLAKQIS